MLCSWVGTQLLIPVGNVSTEQCMTEQFQARSGKLLPLEALAGVTAGTGHCKSDVTAHLYAGSVVGLAKARHIGRDS